MPTHPRGSVSMLKEIETVNNYTPADPRTLNLTDTAIADYCRLVGHDDFDLGERELAREFAEAHFVRVQTKGAELWRGRRPHRYQFIVHVTTESLVVSRVLAEYRGKVTHRERRSVPIRVRDATGNDTTIELTIVDAIYERGGSRRIAFEFPDGGWAEARRGARLGEVQGLRLLAERPDWAVDHFFSQDG